MSGGLLPNAEQTFLDINGDPLTAGQVFFYIPGTTTPKDTWVDLDLSVVNTNPVILDQAGRATIWGTPDGYRQVVLDQFGNLQWDRVVQALFPNSTQGGLTVNGGLVVNNAGEPGGPSNIYGGLVIEAGTGQSVALEVLGAIASPSGTGGLNIDNGLIVNADAGQLVALETNGDIQCNGLLATTGDIACGGDLATTADVNAHRHLNVGDPAGSNMTYSDGRIVSVSSPDQPGFVLYNSTDNVNVGMWAADGSLIWGPSDGPNTGSPTGIWARLNTDGHMQASSFDVFSDENLKRDIRSLDADCIGIVRKTTTRRYKIGDDEKEHWGFTAQDLNLATEGAIGAEGAVSLGGLLSVVWKAIQEIDQRLGAMQERTAQMGVQLDRAMEGLLEQRKMIETLEFEAAQNHARVDHPTHHRRKPE